WVVCVACSYEQWHTGMDKRAMIEWIVRVQGWRFGLPRPYDDKGGWTCGTCSSELQITDVRAESEKFEMEN
ncbi:MAG: hypothetical protein DRP45_12040, partial [Candidatus Zixiibacteriota bacterium]